MIKKIFKFFDRLEDRVRKHLSSHPIIYALISGVAVVSFWRGVWETSDILGLHPLTSLAIGVVLLLGTGVFVFNFIGNQIIISGLKGEKKVEEKTIEEINGEEQKLDKIYRKLEKIEGEIEEINNIKS